MKESSEVLGGFLLQETVESLGITISEGNKWLSEFEKLLQDEKSREILKARIDFYFRPSYKNKYRLLAQASENCKYVAENIASIRDFRYTVGTPIFFMD